MRKFLFVTALALIPVAAFATGKPCEELKGEIQAKLDAKGVKSATLEVVAKDAVTTGKVIGSCEGGTKQIVYSRK